MNKFYSLVSKKDEGAGFSILLDGKPVKTPNKNILLVSNATAADLVVREWADQEDQIKPEDMPFTQFATTCQERVSVEREAMEAQVLKYLDTDLICYRASLDHDENQKIQNAQQEKLWNPWIEWFENRFDVKLETTTGLSVLKQDEKAHQGLKDTIQKLDNDHFTLLQIIVPLSGSVILGLAFIEKDISPEQLFKAVHIEEDFKAELYNEDALHGRAPLEEKKDAAMMKDLNAAQAYLDALSS